MATKRWLFLFIILLSMAGTKALAYDIAVKNSDGVTIYYNYIGPDTGWSDLSDITELEVTYKNENFNSYSGDVNIPENVTYNNITRKVTRIGWRAFSDCSSLTSVTMPNSVKSIEDCAFWACSNLTSITMPNNLTSIGENAFAISI